MRERGICGVSRRKGTVTTIRNRDARPAPDLVDRNFRADRPDQLWVAGIACIPTWAGFLYLAIVLDVFSRRVVGWAMANHLRTELVLEALDMAIFRPRPNGVIHHSDQGTQYTSIAFGKRCSQAGVWPSMGSVVTAAITRCARASTRRSNASCSRSIVSRPSVKPRLWSSISSRDGTTRIAGIRRSATSSPNNFERRMDQAA